MKETTSISVESQEVGVEYNDDGDQLVEGFSLKITKLKKNVIRKMIDGDISVPWYAWGHHVSGV